MATDVNLSNGMISYYDNNDLEKTNEVESIRIVIGEDIHDVYSVSRIVSLEIQANGVERELLDDLSNELYNKYCDREFSGEIFDQKQQAANLISKVTGVPSDRINVLFE